VIAVAGAVALAPAPPASAYPFANVSLLGHGFGHGRGMGQWGALGDALNGMSEAQIISSYYGTLSAGGATTLGAMPNGWVDGTTSVKVDVTSNDGGNVIVTSDSAFTVTGAAATFGPGGTYITVMLQLDPRAPGAGEWNVWATTSAAVGGCGGPWAQIASDVADPVVAPAMAAAFPSDGNLANEVLQLCRGGGNLSARGAFQGVTTTTGNQARTVNIVTLGQYVADVTPAESPASWGALGAAGPQSRPQGFQALEAQAVAVRSYVMSTYGSLQGWFGYADICDSTQCQDYPGIADENATTDAAVVGSANQAVLLPSGLPARTEYSSSTGGYSAGGTFAPVPDAGDAVCVPGACNSHHTWSAQIPVTAIEAAYPQIGSLVSVGVSQRNGLGDLGGRVLEVTVQGAAQSVTVSGDSFAAQFAAFGVQSDWFAVTSQPSGGVGGYWLLGNDGGVFAFGSAAFHGSTGGLHLNKPVVGMAPTPDGGGYFLVAADGGVFAFGDARFAGSTGGLRLNQPVVGMAPTPDGGGYFLVAADGGVFCFGDAPFEGSLPGLGVHATAVSLLATRTGDGYLIVTANGRAVDVGDAPQFGDVTEAVPGFGGRLVGGATVAG
jgi:SpoIID/LytB domain protein